TDLGSIASAVGGDRVEVTAIAKPGADVHRVEVLPSSMVRVSKAQLYLKVGLGLDQWADAIIDGSRNASLVIVDCSTGVEVLDKPTGRVDASQGDVHPNGNPHYWLDPHAGGVVAQSVAAALGRVDPEHAAAFAERAQQIAAECDSVRARAVARAAALPTKTLITYHASWVYFAHALGLEIVGTVEPVPGIPPTGRHLDQLVQLIRERKVQVLIQEPYFAADAGEFLKRQTGIRVVKVSPSADDVGPTSYLAHFQSLIDALSSSSGS
ncbi:MAG TPA: metal ABC transporter substrate-binding protein, partial [Candidatus Udaeobacter sp.]|nr:metal ABC transporter substrate-binding protein [Candidatus Udaeobacter sp.]